MAKAAVFIPNEGNLTLVAEQVSGRIAEIVLEETQRLCPVDTGRLRASYRVERVETKKFWARWSVVTDVEYAPYVEFGTRRMRAQPHLGPALRLALAQKSKWWPW